MSDWTSGYVADIEYTHGYYTELNPLRAKLAFLHSGLRYPHIETACDLGFGQGVSANIHAAGSPIAWYGTDFNPAQAGLAAEMAEAAGSGAKLFDDAFADFANRTDLPDFDFIGLHGIWSWISDENRHILVDFIRKKLKVGGIVYASYNTMPGWAAFAPMRHLMAEHAEIIGSEGRGTINRLNDAVLFAEKMLKTNPAFLRANPLVADRIKKMKEQNPHYLAHEYFNKNWNPMHFGTVANWFDPAKIQFACSAHYLDQVDVLNLTTEQQAFLKEVPDPMLRESVKDFLINQQFRRDYWVKGLRKLTPLEQTEEVRAQRLMLVTPASDVPMKINVAAGQADLNKAIYEPLLEYMGDHKVHSVHDMELALKEKGLGFSQLIQAVIVLAGNGNIVAVQDEGLVNKVRKRTERLNAYIMKKSRSSNDFNYMASPVTSGGYNIDRIGQLFLHAYLQGMKQNGEWADFAWQVLKSQKQRLMREGKAIEGDEENLKEMKLKSELFAKKYLPILKALQIV